MHYSDIKFDEFSPFERKLRVRYIIIIMNFVVVSSVGIKRVVCIFIGFGVIHEATQSCLKICFGYNALTVSYRPTKLTYHFDLSIIIYIS